MIDYQEKGQTITGALLASLREKIMEKRRGMLPKGVLFLQVNAPAHKSHIAMKRIWDLGF
jgi:hypothetical protein